MTMGPEPMIRMRWRSLRLGIGLGTLREKLKGPQAGQAGESACPTTGRGSVGLDRQVGGVALEHWSRPLPDGHGSVGSGSVGFHEGDEIVEEVVRIVRAGGGLGVILHAEDRMTAMPEAFERLVVEVHVGD